MYIGYRFDRQVLGVMCLKDIEVENVVLEIGVIFFSITIFVNSSLFMNNRDLTDQSYSNKASHERVISNISNQNLNTLDLITKLRSGGDNLPENPDQNLEKIDESLKESVILEKLQKNIVSKSIKDSKSFTDNSFNKIVIGIINKMEPIIGNPKILSILAKTQKPVKIRDFSSIII